MQLCASNIGWAAEDDTKIYAAMKARGFAGVEIAPTRLFAPPAYEKANGMAAYAARLRDEYDLVIPSMQSIWYGREERVFGTDEERRTLVDYTKQAVDFARAAGCPSLVFGCPKNRSFPDGADVQTAVAFFNEIGAYAAAKNCVIALEANPPVYHTNFMNTTAEAFVVAAKCGAGIAVNLDFGTIIANGETLDNLARNLPRVSHVHISEPGLAPIERRAQHKALAAILYDNDYQGFVSIEMRTQPFDDVLRIMDYTAEVFG